ncbi:50S ribosomal protein L5 [Candidatus Kuenenbacteria bacterium]|nr:50S ribosomal protein L5 [Candidatus Kuenenbacteria bacterium]
MSDLYTQYKKEVVPALVEKFGYKNKLAAPTIKKVVINVGIGSGLKDKDFLATVKNTLTRISGQKPVETLARKSISNFKIREGNIVGVKVTLRGERMWEFVEKLVRITFPRERDFRGLETTGFDRAGNYSVGFREFIAFPEINQDEVDKLHGLEISVSTTAENKEQGLTLLSELGFPFKKG